MGWNTGPTPSMLWHAHYLEAGGSGRESREVPF